jgi:hypothetical protein
MKKILILFILFCINCETWFNEIYGADENDGKKGYAGSRGKAITHFYLNGNREYRVHFLGNAEDDWTKPYTGGEVIGIGPPIDAISISGGKYYRVRFKNGNWGKRLNGYNINDKNNGYAGALGKEIDAILIEGGDGYRVAYGEESSHPIKAANRVIKNLLGVDYTLNYEKETFIAENNYARIYGIVTGSYNYDGKKLLNLIIKNNKLVDIGIDKINIFEELNKVLNFDIKNIKTKFEKSFEKGIANGEIQISFYWLQKKLEIFSGTKITADHHSFRGGFKIIIYIKDKPDKPASYAYILEPCKVLLKRLGQAGEAIMNSLILNVNINEIIKTTLSTLENTIISLVPCFMALIVLSLLFG